MKRMVALLLGVSLVHPSLAHADDDLKRALEQLRGHVAFKDMSKEGRLRRFGTTLMKVGAAGVEHSPELAYAISDDDDDDDNSGAILLVWLAASAAAIGLGGASYLAARVIGDTKSAPLLTRTCTAYYMTAAGFNTFMRFPIEEQYVFAESEPDLRKFLIKLNTSYNLIKYYGVIKNVPIPVDETLSTSDVREVRRDLLP